MPKRAKKIGKPGPDQRRRLNGRHQLVNDLEYLIGVTNHKIFLLREAIIQVCDMYDMVQDKFDDVKETYVRKNR